MAVLPSKYNLSGPSSLRSGRQIASMDTTAIGRGIAQAGNALVEISDDMKKREDALGLAKAEAEKSQGLIQTSRSFDNDPDYATFGDRAPKVTGDIVNKAAQNIKDPNLRARWIEGARTDAVRTDTAILNKADSLGQQATQASVDETLETQRRIYADPQTSDEDKAKALDNIKGTLEVSRSSGIFTPAEAEARKKAYLDGAYTSRAVNAAETGQDVVSRPMPQDVAGRSSAALAFFQSKGWTKEQAAGIVGNLLAESTLNTQGRNRGDGVDGSDSIGVAQWNGSRAKALHDFAAARGKDWHDFETQLAFVDHELRTSPQERAAFNSLKSARNVDEATAAFIGYERPQDWTAANPRAGHNYKGRLRYAAQVAGIDPDPEWAKNLSPEDRIRVGKIQDRVQQEQAVQLRGDIEIATQNAPVAIQNTGTYTGSVPTISQFMTAYGPQEGAQRFEAFQTSVDTARQTFEFKTASNDEITAAVTAARPTSTGTGAALEQKRYDVLSKAAEETIKARNSDPASYVMSAFPSVKSAWDNSQNGDYSQALAMTAAAQQRLGIQNMQLLPKSVAAQAVEAFKTPDANDQQKLGPVSSLVFATNDPKQRQAIFNQLVDAGLPAMTEGALEAQARGDIGAANRLLQASIVDTSKLPVDKVNTPDVISSTLFENVWAPGSIGEASYGTSYGDASSLERAQRGSDLLKKAVQIRLAQGQDLESAVSGASKDLFGDKTVYTGSGNVNANLPVPTGTDTDILGAGLEISKESIRRSLTAQAARATGQTEDKFLAVPAPVGLAEKGNIDLTARPVVKNEDGSVSTVRSMSFNEDGVEILIPTVSPDGKILSDDDAIKLYEQTGQHLGKFQTAQQADAYAEELHKQQERMYPGGISFKASDGSKAILDATVSNRINDILENGVFVPVGEGVGFRDPYTGTLVVDDKGDPISIPLARIIESGKSQVPADEPVEATPSQPAGLAPNPADTWDFMTLPGGNQ